MLPCNHHMMTPCHRFAIRDTLDDPQRFVTKGLPRLSAASEVGYGPGSDRPWVWQWVQRGSLLAGGPCRAADGGGRC